MSNLSNLYISQSYFGVINLENSLKPFASASGEVQLQDGLGEQLGISINAESKNLTISNDLIVSGTSDFQHVDIHDGFISDGLVFINGNTNIFGNTTITGSLSLLGNKDIIGDLDVTGSITAENNISSSTLSGIGNVESYSQSIDTRFNNVELYTSSLREAFEVSGTNVSFNGDISVSGSISAYEIHTTIESASVIFSSGSNVLGDEPSDTQIFSGSVYVPNLHYLAGNSTDTNLRINQNLPTASYLVDSASFDTRIIRLDNFSASFSSDYATVGELDTTASFLQSEIDTKLDTASYIIDSSSFDTRIDDLESFSSSLDTNFVSEDEFIIYSSSVYNIDTTQTNKINGLSSFTGSYATTGSNDFIGNQSITGNTSFTGSLNIDGKVQGNVVTVTPSLGVATLDCSLGNFFTINSTESFELRATNIVPGQTIGLRLTIEDISVLVTNDTSIKWPSGYEYQNSEEGSDIITFISFDSSTLYGVVANLYI